MSNEQRYGGYSAGEGRYEAQYGREYDPYAGSSSDPSAGSSAAPSAEFLADGRWAGDPYAVGPGGSDPYAAGPLTAHGFGPSFSAASAAPSGHPTGPYPFAPGDGGGYGAVRPSSGSAIAGFVLGLLALIMCAGLTAPVGIILSAKGMRETGPTAAAPKDGRGLAIAGLVLSLVGLIPLLIMLAYIVLVIVMIAAGSTS